MPGYEAMEEVHVHTHMYLDRYGRVVSTPKYFLHLSLNSIEMGNISMDMYTHQLHVWACGVN